MKRIIYIDFDGTLLADDRSLPEVNRQCLKRLLSDGHILAFNTGRSIKSGMGLIKGFGLSDPNIYLLSFQGNMIYHPAEEKVLYESGIERNDGVELLKKVNSMGIYCHTYNDEGLLTIEDMGNENLKKYVEITGEPVAYIDSWEEVKTPTIPKVICIDYKHPEKLHELYDEYHSSGDERFENFFSTVCYLEFTKKGTNKGVGVK
ncbi:MAG: HAD-IIB family hydrolase, partial [Lachnospiraceae bacterium]|nr:HAD-IIB family hydrolase [Lachnospiraceae bacterium]